MRRARIQPAARADISLLWFSLLNEDEQRAAIFRLADRGFSDHYIASATHVELSDVRRILGAR